MPGLSFSAFKARGLIALTVASTRSLTPSTVSFASNLWEIRHLEPHEVCILVAEDQTISRYTMVRSLSKQGYCVIEAVDGKDALAKVAAYDGHIHLLVTNVRMPNMDGHELARELKRERPDVQILIVSGDHEENFPPEAVHHSDALMKPVDTATLLGKVDQLLRRHPAAQRASVQRQSPDQQSITSR